MLDFITSLVLASLLIPSGFNFLADKAIDYSYIQPQTNISTPVRVVNNSFGLKTSAKSILVIDNNSGAVLYSKNSKAVLPIASITKLVTALVVLDNNPEWEKEVTIKESDQRDGGIVYLLPGEVVTVKDLFNLMLTASSNEAAIALARSSDLQDFNAAMNNKAAQLEMFESYFLDPSGIEPGNTSSPGDLIKLAKAAFSNSQITEVLENTEYQFEIINNQRLVRAFSTDLLLNSFLNQEDYGYNIIGAKTGYLDEAGYCILIQVEKSQGQSITIAMLGAKTIIDRWQDTKGLVDWIFSNYQWDINEGN